MSRRYLVVISLFLALCNSVFVRNVESQGSQQTQQCLEQWTISGEGYIKTSPVEVIADGVGRSLSGLGDVDGDGISEIAIYRENHIDAGKLSQSNLLQVYSVAKEKIVLELTTLPTDGAEASVGETVIDSEDLDGDGRNDILVSRHHGLNGASVVRPGSVSAYSPSKKQLLYTVSSGAVDHDRFGASILSVSDLDDDGVSDFVVGAPLRRNPECSEVYFPNCNKGGAIYVFSGRNGELLGNVFHAKHLVEFGSALGNAGDLNGDGYDELYVSAPFDNLTTSGYGVGTIYVLSSKAILFPDQSLPLVVTILRAPVLTQEFGRSFVVQPEMFSCGHRALLVQHKQFDGSQWQDKISQVNGCSDGYIIDRSIYGGKGKFARDMVVVGDIDFDGFTDFAYAEPEFQHSGGTSGKGRVTIISGKDFASILSLGGDSSSRAYGKSIALFKGSGPLQLPLILIGDDSDVVGMNWGQSGALPSSADHGYYSGKAKLVSLSLDYNQNGKPDACEVAGDIGSPNIPPSNGIGGSGSGASNGVKNPATEASFPTVAPFIDTVESLVAKITYNRSYISVAVISGAQFKAIRRSARKALTKFINSLAFSITKPGFPVLATTNEIKLAKRSKRLIKRIKRTSLKDRGQIKKLQKRLDKALNSLSNSFYQ